VRQARALDIVEQVRVRFLKAGPRQGCGPIYHVVYEHEGFEDAARKLYEMVRSASPADQIDVRHTRPRR
jgi:hypothetical protein